MQEALYYGYNKRSINLTFFNKNYLVVSFFLITFAPENQNRA